MKSRDEITPEELLASLLSPSSGSTALERLEQRKRNRLRLVAAEREAKGFV